MKLRKSHRTFWTHPAGIILRYLRISEIRGSIAIDAVQEKRKPKTGSGATEKEEGETGEEIRLFFGTVSRQLVRDNWSADALEP